MVQLAQRIVLKSPLRPKHRSLIVAKLAGDRARDWTNDAIALRADSFAMLETIARHGVKGLDSMTDRELVRSVRGLVVPGIGLVR